MHTYLHTNETRSRLWCVFELAAYRKANPDGKIRLAPLFVERQAERRVETSEKELLFLISF